MNLFAPNQPVLKQSIFFVLLLITLLFINPVFSQTNISGVINDYVKVTAVDNAQEKVTVTSSSAFSIGDKVMLIQMQGASIDNSQSSSFGTITNYNNAGDYEIQTVCDVQGNDIYFAYDLLNSYNPNESVQLVRIPVYNNATISGSFLTAQAWNGNIGGVLALEVTGTLTFWHNINVIGKGFRGATAALSGGGCSFILDNSYYTHMNSSDEKALKGEGISRTISGKECGRGPQANGGGGGNNHNGGGGGGANFGAGGRGGERIQSSFFTCGSYYGLTSKNLVSGYNNQKLFMGGGGGAGHVNNVIHNGEHGANGSGIVFIRANNISGNNNVIYAYGASANGNAVNDGGGGAGAGGTVVLDVDNYPTGLNILVNGGNGANVANTGSSNCNGPGGGGGAGVIMFKGSSTPTNINANILGGYCGQIISEQQNNCSVGNTNNAVHGSSGAVLYNLSVKESTINSTVCSFSPLPVEWLYFNAEVFENKQVKLDWATASEANNSHFEIERSANGTEWEMIGTIQGSGTSSQINKYHFFDKNPLNGISYYRIKQIDYNGVYDYSEIKKVNFIGLEIINLFPNPSPGIINLTLNSTENTNAIIQLYMINGKNIYNRQIELQKGFMQYTLDFNYLQKGVYVFKLTIPESSYLYQTRLQLLD